MTLQMPPDGRGYNPSATSRAAHSSTDDFAISFRPPAKGDWVVIPRDVDARSLSGVRVELPLWVAREILLSIPASVATEHRVFRVDASDETFTLLMPEEGAPERIDLLRFILNRNFDVLYGQAAQIDRLLAVAFGEATGVREVSTCNARFRVQCPLQWNSLLPTADSATRFCDACRQPVYLCDNDEEARLRAAAGQCVAIEGRRMSNDESVLMGLLEDPSMRFEEYDGAAGRTLVGDDPADPTSERNRWRL